MEHATSSNGDSASAKFSGQPAESSGAPTSVAAAAPESSTLAVKLSEDQANSPEAVYRRGSAENDLDNKKPDQPDSRSIANTGEGEGESERGGDGPQSQVIRRSRSGRLLRTTVQYDERSSRGSSPEETSETQGSYSRRTRLSVRRQDGEHSGDGTKESNEQDRYNSSLRNQKSPGAEKQVARQSENNSDKEGSDRSYYSDGRGQGPEYREDNRDELATDEDQEEDGYAEDGDDVQQEEGSESMDNNSSKNGDSGDPLVVSMYGSPSLVKVRSMFIDKLYKMVEDPSIQHLISWAKEGDMFYVFNCIELSSSVLPKFFKHNNWQSFVRQLNMYGFHKIYRYDREESTLNRRNPETQRWQFYHPDFQRDRPHLRSNIKRKSARSINIAPTFSRVVFERDKGYYVQQDSTGRPFSGHGGHNRAHSSIQLQDPARHGYMHGAPPSGPHHFNPHPSHLHQPPHDSNQRHPPPRAAAGYRPHPSEQYPVEFMHSREDKEMMARRDHGHAPHPQTYPGPPYHQQHPSYGGAHHQRQHSYAGPPPPPQYSSDPYGPKSQGPPPNGFSSPHGPPPPPPQQDPYHSGAPPSHPAGPGRLENREGHSPGRDPGYLEHGHDYKQGMHMNGGHFRSQSAPGLDPRRAEAPRGPHPFSQQDHPRSPPPAPPHPNAQSYFPRESYPTPHSQPSRHSPHRQPFEESPSKGLAGADTAVGPSGESSAPPGRGSVTKHPLSPMGHSQPHPSASPSGHHPPTPSQVQHPYTDQHRRNHSMAMGEPMDVDKEHARQRRFTPPPPPSTHGRQGMPPPSPSSLPHSHPQGPPPSSQHPQAPLDPALPVEPHGVTPGMDPVAPHPSAHDLVPRTVKQLEDRLHFVEDAYMSLRQFAQELQNIQVSQDHTIAWMRDRIDQLMDLGSSRGISSPPLPHSGGVVPSKRKAEYSPSDSRDWPRRGPGPNPGPGPGPGPEHPHQHSYQRQGLPASGPLAPPAPPPSQGPGASPPGHGGQQQQSQHPQQQQQQQPHSVHGVSGGPANAGRYETATYHNSPFNPAHHPAPSPRTPSQ